MQLSGTHRVKRSDDRRLCKEHERDFWLCHAENSIEAGHVVTFDSHILFKRFTMLLDDTLYKHEIIEINLQWKFGWKGGYQLDPFGRIIVHILKKLSAIHRFICIARISYPTI
jgi:hypothetical protein